MFPEVLSKDWVKLKYESNLCFEPNSTAGDELDQDLTCTATVDRDASENLDSRGHGTGDNAAIDELAIPIANDAAPILQETDNDDINLSDEEIDMDESHCIKETNLTSTTKQQHTPLASKENAHDSYNDDVDVTRCNLTSSSTDIAQTTKLVQKRKSNELDELEVKTTTSSVPSQAPTSTLGSTTESQLQQPLEQTNLSTSSNHY